MMRMRVTMADRGFAVPLLALLAVAAAVPMAHASLQADPSDPNAELAHIIIIDAGSTGSRVHVHPYRQQHPVPHVMPSESIKVKPGLSSFLNDPEGGGKSIIELLEFAKKKVPMHLWETTPVFLKATAGLRSIPRVNAEAILAACRVVIAKYPFTFHPNSVEIISGTQEGIFGWISANYLDGRFAEGKDTIGVIEMGGASLQVTFVPKDPAARHHPDLKDVTLGPYRYRLYTYSYLNFGLEAAQQMFLTKYRNEIDEDGHPCYLSEYTDPDGVRGIGKAEKCASLISDMFDKEKCPKTCSFNGIYQPRITDERFYAIENFFYTTEFFGLLDERDPWTIVEYKGKEFCHTNWRESVVKYPKESEVDLSKYCFSSQYLPTMLRVGLGFELPARNTKVVKRVNGVSIDWALGAVIDELMKRPTPSAPVSGVPDLTAGVWADSWAGVFPAANVYAAWFLAAVVVGLLIYILRVRAAPRSGKGKSSCLTPEDARKMEI